MGLLPDRQIRPDADSWWPEEDGDVHVLASRNAQAAAAYRSGRVASVASLFQRVLQDCADLLGVDHVATLTVAGNFGTALFSAGRRSEGVRAMTATLNDRVRVWGESDPGTLSARDALATAYRLSGAVDDAVALSRRVTEQRRRVLGPTLLDTLTSRMGLALAHVSAGDVDAAVVELTSAISDSERTHGRRHTHTVALLESGRSSGLIRKAS